MIEWFSDDMVQTNKITNLKWPADFIAFVDLSTHRSDDSASLTISPYSITTDDDDDVDAVVALLSPPFTVFPLEFVVVSNCCIIPTIVQSKYFRTGNPASLEASVNISTLRILTVIPALPFNSILIAGEAVVR